MISRAQPRPSASQIRALKTLAQSIDRHESRQIKARGRAAFARHERLRDIVASLRAERKRQGLSLADLAARTGIAKPNLSRLENNATTAPTFDSLHRYAQALGKTLRIEIVAARRAG